MNINKIFNFTDALYKHPYYYLYSMTIYHIIIIFFTYYNIDILKNKVYFSLSFGFAESINHNLNAYSLKNIIFTLLIVFLDLLFLFILAYEFKSLKLTMKKISIIESIIFIFTLTNPYLRTAMLFLSLNSLQIFIPYIIMKNISITKYMFLTISYTNVIQTAIYPAYILLILSTKS